MKFKEWYSKQKVVCCISIFPQHLVEDLNQRFGTIECNSSKEHIRKVMDRVGDFEVISHKQVTAPTSAFVHVKEK